MNVESAMLFAMEQHKGQVRKYTGEPYVVHLAEVAGLVYRDECSALLDVLKNADTTLMRLARESLE